MKYQSKYIQLENLNIMMKKLLYALVVIFLGFQNSAKADPKTEKILEKLRQDCQVLLVEAYKSENSFNSIGVKDFVSLKCF